MPGLSAMMTRSLLAVLPHNRLGIFDVKTANGSGSSQTAAIVRNTPYQSISSMGDDGFRCKADDITKSLNETGI